MSSSILIRETKNGLSFDIHVNPHASRAGISGISEGMLKIKVTAPPVEGAANEACIDLLAKSLKLRKSQMKISTGAKGRKKPFWSVKSVKPIWNGKSGNWKPGIHHSKAIRINA